MDPWVWWLVIAVGLAAVEIFTLDLFFAMFAAGALAAAGTSAAGGNVLVSTIVFGVVSAAMLGVVRPIGLRHLKRGPALKTGVDALTGAKAVVLERVDAHTGTIKLAGEVWTARTLDEASVLEPGATVDVVEIRGATAYVL